MGTKHLIEPVSPDVLSRAADLVRAGEIIGFPTDTFYGLGADPSNVAAIDKLRRLKGREGDKPILVVISDLNLAERFIESRSDEFQLLATHFWAGELTIIEQAKSNVAAGLKSLTGTIGLRLPGAAKVRQIIRACGGALTATSANPAGMPAAKSPEEVLAYFPTGLSLVINGGKSSSTLPSTIVDVSTGVVRIIREGVISRTRLSQIVKLSD